MWLFLLGLGAGMILCLLVAYARHVLRVAEALQFQLPWFQWFAIGEVQSEAAGATIFLALQSLHDRGVLEVRLNGTREALLDHARRTRDYWAEEVLSEHDKPNILLAARYYEFRLVRRGKPREDRKSFFEAEPSWRPLPA